MLGWHFFNPDIGMIVRDGDGDALIQHTKKQNSHVEYESVPYGEQVLFSRKRIKRGVRPNNSTLSLVCRESMGQNILAW